MPRIPYKSLTQSDELSEKLEMSTAEIGLSVRTTNCLEEKGIFTVHDLLNCTRADLLSISNFGEKALEHPSKLFQRFYRESNETKSTGLGLAIVKKICDLYQFKVSYKFDKMHHIFSVNFSTK